MTHTTLKPKCGDSARVEYPLSQKEDGGSIPTSPLQMKIYPIPQIKAYRLTRYSRRTHEPTTPR